MAGDYEYIAYSGGFSYVYAAYDSRLLTHRQQWFENCHPFRKPGGEYDQGNFDIITSFRFAVGRYDLAKVIIN